MTATIQSMTALQRANEIRIERARVKQAVKNGDVSLLDALENPACASAWVFDVLCWQRRYGREKAIRLLARLEISPARPCSRLTVRQRMMIIEFC